jgi:hypothetical protein
MQPKGVPFQFALQEDGASPADFRRTAGVTTLTGCGATILATFMPWVEKAVFGVDATAIGIKAAGMPLAVLATISAAIACVVLMRRPATARIAIVLIVMAMAQLGLAIWFGSSIVLAIEQVDSHLVLISAIGTGAYLSVAGSLITLAGAILALMRRPPEPSGR